MIVIAIAQPVGAHSSRHKPTPTCGSNHGHVITADRQALLYEAPETFGPIVVYGCAYGHKRSYDLGYAPKECGSGGCISIEHETLAGPYAAFEFLSVGGRGEEKEETFLIIVRDLRTGRVVHKVPTGMHSPQKHLAVGAGIASAIVLKNDGSVAWIVDKEPEYQVHLADKTGSRLLAAGPNIDPHSLALAGNTIYWTENGQPHSATLV